MKNINTFIYEKLNNFSPYILATYYFRANNKENGYTNNTSNEHPTITKKFLDIVKSHYISEVPLTNAILDKEGHESVLKIEYKFYDAGFSAGDKLFDDVDEMIKELSNLNDISFIEYKNGEDYKTN